MTAPIRSMPRQCGRKARYDSEFDARMGLAEHHGRWERLNVYLCPHCEFWHVGHTIREDA